MITVRIHRLCWYVVCLAALLFPQTMLADVLVVAGKQTRLGALNVNQVRDVFLGKISSLPDGTGVTVVDQASPVIREEFYSKLLNRTASQARAHWARMHFTGRAPLPVQAQNDTEVKKIVNTIPGAIGYIDRQAQDSSVNILLLERGVEQR